jgi:hypothetical protein
MDNEMKIKIEDLEASMFKVLASNRKVGVVLSIKGNVLTDEPFVFLVTSAQYDAQEFKSIDFALKAYNLILGA